MYHDYRISNNKRRPLNNRLTFGYSYWNKQLSLINTAPLIAALIRIVAIFY